MTHRKEGNGLNILALKQKMLEKDKSNKEIAAQLHISRSAIQRKLAGESEFDRKEIKQLINILHLTNEEVMFIFFDEKVS